MHITRQIVEQGNWLFRWRSYLPFLLLPILLITLNSQSGNWQTAMLSQWDFFSLGISLLGLLIRCFSIGRVPVGTSGRNTRSQVAEQLNTLGIYSMVRHPLYLGNFLIGFGIFLAPASITLAIIYSLAFWLYYERIMAAEEAFLATQFGAEFSDWVANTPAFIPDPALWKPANLPFSFKTVLRREYTGLLVVVLFQAGVFAARQYFSTGTFQINEFWAIALGVTATAYLTLRALKKHTKWLSVPGR